MVQDALVETFLAARPDDTEPGWLAALRDDALHRFADIGIPTPRQEAWRFSDYRALRSALAMEGTGAPAPSLADIAPFRFDGDTHRLVFVDGNFSMGLSSIGALPPGVRLCPLAQAIDTRPDLAQAAFPTPPARPFAALNAGLVADGMVLAVDAGVVLAEPVELIQFRVAAGPPVQLRHLITLGAGAEATVIETVTGSGIGGSNSVTVTNLAEGAKLTHVKLQADSDMALHLAQTSATLGAKASLEAFFLVLGSALSRQEIDVALTGPKTLLALNGCTYLTGRQESTIAPLVDHQTTGGETSELFKSVLEDDAHSVFLGKIVVREGADFTAAHQQNRNLLTSSTARVDTKPELTIHADEVKCSHGATVGDLDENSLFYLLARGIDPATARRMLIEAFAAETIERSALPLAIQGWLRTQLDTRLRAKGGTP